jgi:hypothetical protein
MIEVLRALDTHGIAPVSMTVREPSLDDVFLTLTGHHVEEEEAGPKGKAPAKAGAR